MTTNISGHSRYLLKRYPNLWVDPLGRFRPGRRDVLLHQNAQTKGQLGIHVKFHLGRKVFGFTGLQTFFTSEIWDFG